MKLLKAEYTREDSRGTLTQVATNSFNQLNILTINSDCTFGGHFHKYKQEIFYMVSGLVRIDIDNDEKKKSFTGYLKPGDILLIEPFDKHSFTAIIPSVLAEAMTHPYSKEDIYE